MEKNDIFKMSPRPSPEGQQVKECSDQAREKVKWFFDNEKLN